MIKYIALVAVVISLLTGAFFYGRSVGVTVERVKWQTKQLDLNKQLQDKANTITVITSERDMALAKADEAKAQIVTKEVVKYVTKYRDRISVNRCVDDSGLFDIINTAMPTCSEEITTN